MNDNGWNAETANWYAEKYGDYPTNRLVFDYVRLDDAATVVDIGCGTGAALREAAARISSGRLIGVDPIPRMLEIARARTHGTLHSERLEFVLGPAHQVPLADAIADVVLALDSFDHWGEEHQLAGLREVHRILKPGGSFVIVKDGEIPSGNDDERLRLLAGDAGLSLLREELVVAEVGFTIWVFLRAPC